MSLKIHKKINIRLFCMVLIFLTADFPLYPGNREGEGVTKLIVTPVLIKSDVSVTSMNDVSAAIRKNLQGDDYFIVNEKFVPDVTITFNNYITGSCVTELAKVIPEGIIILVAIKKGDVKVGEIQHSRYVVEDIVETRYTIYVSTVDLIAGKYDLRFREMVNDTAKLTDEADLIGKKIREFYIRRKSEVKTDAVKRDSPLINILSIKQDVSYVTWIHPALLFSSLNPWTRMNTK